jgi:propionyl-CoA carboxylase alpha chain
MRGAREMGIRTVAVYVDADAAAPFVQDADEAVRLPGSYLEGKAIIEAAQKTGAGAIHPGYGFLSENAGFAKDVAAAGITWVGPSPETIEQMGDKIAAKALATKANVPTLPGSNDINDDASVGYPLLVKAAAGGGGKGMRIVESPDDLKEKVAAAQREAASGFGDDRVFLERYVARARHIEIQILGDSHGKIVHLGERECSIQRRHQKILEESPSPRVNEKMRTEMGDAALRLASELGYESAGTVEFLVDDDTGEFFFLEVNTRLQVEHPVTEAVTGIDLVREQLRIARGEALGYEQSDIQFSGCAIEARLYAEDPAAGFLPRTGTLVAFAPGAAPQVRWDSGVEQGSVVGTDFDPMLAKVIAHAPTRSEAAGRLALALEQTHLGGVTTNRDFLAATLRNEAFLAGDTTTDFIDRVDPPRSLEVGDDELVRYARIGAMFVQSVNRSEAAVLGSMQSGWRNARMPAQRLTLRFNDTDTEVAYRTNRDGSFRFDDGTTARVHAADAESIDVEIDGRRSQSRVTRDGENLIVQVPRGDISFFEVPRFEIPGTEDAAGGFIARMPGRVLELRVAVGDTVTAGQTVLLLEAMKMEHPMNATEDGVVTQVHVTEGEQVASGTLLLVVEASEGEAS